jgi:hypothetical protein
MFSQRQQTWGSIRMFLLGHPRWTRDKRMET